MEMLADMVPLSKWLHPVDLQRPLSENAAF